MPYPEGAQLNPSSYNPLLTSMAGGLLLNPGEFIAEMVAPTIPVAAASGSFNVWKRGDFLRRGGKRLANYEAPPIEGFSTTSANYSVDNWGVATMWTAKDLSDARAGGTPDGEFINAKLEFVTTKGMLEREIAVATLCQTSCNWSTTYAGVSSGPTGNQILQWDQSGSDPVNDIVTIVEAFRLLAGRRPNTIIIPIQVINKLKTNVNLIDRIKYGGTMDRPTEVTRQQIQALFDFERFLVPEAVYNSAADGATDAFTYIWGKTIWIGYVAPMPTRETPSAMYNFAWTGDTTNGLPVGISGGAGPQPWDATRDRRTAGLFIRRFRENRPSGEFIESELWITPNVTAASMGVTITTPIA